MAASDYVCKLSPSSLQKAQDELNEVPAERLSAVETFRTWIKQQPHINFPTGTSRAFTYPTHIYRQFTAIVAGTLVLQYFNIITSLRVSIIYV